MSFTCNLTFLGRDTDYFLTPPAAPAAGGAYDISQFEPSWMEPVQNSGTFPQLFANGGYLMPINILGYGTDIEYGPYPLPEVEVDGYKPISLEVYYPGHNNYLVGHSALSSPYMGNKYLLTDKTFNDKGYDFVTNNCADAALSYLNYVFETNKNPYLFTTPGDVRDYAVNFLNGTLIKGPSGSFHDRVLIPITSDNVDKVRQRTQMFYDDYYKDHDKKKDSTYIISNGPLLSRDKASVPYKHNPKSVAPNFW